MKTSCKNLNYRGALCGMLSRKFLLNIFFVILLCNPFTQATNEPPRAHKEETYEPSSLSWNNQTKYLTGVIANSFYHKNNNCKWMYDLAVLYDGRDPKKVQEEEKKSEARAADFPCPAANLGLYRGIVPSAMVDSKGDLYTLSLTNFGASGPEFQLQKCYYSNGEIKTTSVKFYPWKIAYSNTNLKLPAEPKGSDDDKKLFNWSFHNALSPCLFKETEDYDDFLRIFCPIPNQKYVTGNSGVEGGLFLNYNKKTLNSTSTPSASKMYTSSDEGRFTMNRMTSRRYGDSSYAFQNCWGNYQGIVAEYPGNNWLFFLALSESKNFSTCHAYYKKVWSAGFTNKGAGEIPLSPKNNATNDTSDKDIRRCICPRFVRVGSYIYYAMSLGGYWMSFGRMDINGNMKSLGNHISDIYLETTKEGVSDSAYNFDYCVLNKDGTPCTKASPNDTNEDNRKILCVFSLGGGGNPQTGMTADFGWKTTYINWTYNLVCGVISSVLLPANGGSLAATYSAWVQNAIYVTNVVRSGGNCVNITDTKKSDEYRLYLNSHKLVPYTSPSGKHYMIYAYCYPGKKEHLYLGYAQYFVDSDYRVRLLSQTTFKHDGSNGWGASFGAFRNCSRIISMDLKNGHLWITFVGDGDLGCYYYFHILINDLIQE